MLCTRKHQILNLFFFFSKGDYQPSEDDVQISSRRQDKFEEKKANMIDVSIDKEVVTTSWNEEKEKEKISNQIKKYNECVCHFCTLHLKNRSCYLVHSSQHRIYSETKDLHYKCLKCHEVVDELKKLQNHYVEIHKISFDCFICEKKYRKKNTLSQHFSNAHNYKKFSCGECDYSTYTKANFYRHIVSHKRNTGHKCTYCSYRSAKIQIVISHEMDKHKNKRLIQSNKLAWTI